MPITMKLSELANIQMGLVLTRKSVTESCNAVKYNKINLRSLLMDNSIDMYSFDEFYSKEILSEQYLTCEGDILVSSFIPIKPVYIYENTQGLVVPSQLVKITPNEELVYVKYLLSYLSQSIVSDKLSTEVTGTAMRSIKMTSIANLDIPLPSLEKQIKIANYYDLHMKKQNLVTKIKSYEDLLFKYIMQN